VNIHEKYMSRCIQLAKNGLGKTYPNPMVGCVIVHDDKILAEGWHQKAGEPHAEVNAINSLKEKDASLVQKATIYVSLEPCSHFGKTPPCADLIVEKGFKKAVIGMTDPFAKVSGKGIQRLMTNGCDVILGVLEKECLELNKRFVTFHNQKRPYVILKWAESSDGFIAPKEKKEKKPVWITNRYSRQLVHRWRAEEQAILVGTKTVLSDNPSLTVRDWHGNNPKRYILGTTEIEATNYRIRNNKAATVLLNQNVIDFTLPIASQVCNFLFNNDVNSVIIEGGAKTIQSFIDEGLWDEARIFTGSTEIKNGTKAPKFLGKLVSVQNYLSDTLRIYEQN